MQAWTLDRLDAIQALCYMYGQNIGPFMLVFILIVIGNLALLGAMSRWGARRKRR